MKQLLAAVLILGAFVIALPGACAATYYVAQGAPNASDENPGSEEQPWLTLAKATQTAGKGDTIYIKAGIYREKLELKGEGITVQAFGDDAVILQPADEVKEIDPGAWTKVPDRESVYTCDLKVEGDPRGWLMQVDGLALAFEVTQGARRELTSGIGEFRTVELDRHLEDDEGRRWTVDREGKVYVNLGGEEPAEHRLELIKAGPGGVAVSGKNCRVKGVELRFCPLSVGGEDNIVEDCLVQKSGAGVRGRNVLRRCAFYRCDSLGIGTLAIFEENLVVGGQRWVPEKQPPQTPKQFFTPIWGRAIGSNASHYVLIRYNVVADSAIWGFWDDCMAYGVYTYGNSFWRNWSGAIYNEANCHDSRILYNAFVENGTHEHPWSGYGVMLSAANRCLVAYNLCKDNGHFGIGSSLMRIWPNPLDNVIQHNLIQGSPCALYFDSRTRPQGNELRQLMTMSFDNNIYSLPPGGTFAKPGIATLSDFQRLTKKDLNSRMDDHATMGEFGLGTMTFRIPDCEDPDTPVPIVANTFSRGLHQEPLPLYDSDIPLFWNFGNADALPSDSWGHIYSPHWQFGAAFKRTAGWAGDAVVGGPLPANGEQPFWLKASSNSAGAVPEVGSGWWSRSLPTVPGAHIRVSLRVSGQELQRAKGQAVLVLVHFSSATGQHVTRQYLIGGDDDQQILSGTFPWRDFAKEFVAPPEARRFAVFMGLRPCAGAVQFAETHIETLPGRKRRERPMPKDVTYEPVDLTNYFNHDLDKNVTSRIGEGLTGCPGPINLSDLPRGRQLHSGVPFQIERGIALRGSAMPQDTSVPREVLGIRVGQKVAGLYFLHRFAYTARDREQFRYILHLADNTTVEIPVIAGHENIIGRFQRNNVRLFPPPFDLKGGGGVLEWVNRKPQVAVASVDFVSSDTGDGALLGITAVVKK